MSGRKRISLAGAWSYIPDQYCRGESVQFYLPVKDRKAGWRDPADHDTEGVDTIRVPSSWNMVKPELHYFERTLWYYRRFKRPALKKGERAFVCFEGSYYRTKAWLNGRLLGEHLGGFTPFEFEITAQLRRDNLLAVLVDAARDADRCPTTVTDWFAYGGLYRDVFIEVRPPAFLTDVFVHLSRRNEIVASVSATRAGRAVLSLPALGIEQPVRIPGGNKAGRVRIPAPARLKRWSPDAPKLYRASVTFGRDEWTDRVGFRTIETRDGEFVLNGSPIRLKGVCAHEDHLARGRTLTDADRRDIFRQARALGCNFLRLAHYPHSRQMAQMADREGLLLWEEVPVYWRIQWQNPKTFADASNQLRELILRDRNRASVILWSVANETPEDAPGRTGFLTRLSRLARRLDPTRLTTAALFRHDDGKVIYCEDPLAAELDVIGINQYAGWYGDDLSVADEMKRFDNVKYPAKPVIVSEFGGGALAGVHGRFKFSEEYQAAVYRRQLGAFRQARGIRGTAPWILFDFRAPLRVNKYQRGFNRKGLVAADRRTRKLAFEVYRRFDLRGIR